MTVTRPVRVCLVGIGGYGKTYLRALDDLEKDRLAKLSAVVVRDRAKYAAQVAALAARGVTCFARYSDAIRERNFDFVALSTPLQLHRPMVIEALEAGIPTLCEKSAAPTVQDVQAMIDAQARTGIPLDIAYPLQNSSSVSALQRALIDGCVGRVRDVVVRVGWLREERYYQRSAWAGRLKVDGLWTLDGPVNNPTAHYLFAGMYFASSEHGRVARPAWVRGELYRVRPNIDGEDTACIEAEFQNGVRLYFYTTLVTTDKTFLAPRFDVTGELGSVTWTPADPSPIPVRRTDGKNISIPHNGRSGTTKRALANFARYLLGKSDVLYSPVGESLHFARLSNGAFDSSGKVHRVPARYIDRREVPLDEYKYLKRFEGETTLVYELKGIVPAMREAGERRVLFSDLGLPWAVKSERFNVTSYDHFPQRFEAPEEPAP